MNNSTLFPGCSNSLLYPLTFIYPLNYDKVLNELDRLDQTVNNNPSVTAYCEELIRNYLCNYLYPPCDESGTSPLGICEEDCVTFAIDTRCVNQIDFLFALSVEELKYFKHCNNTLLHIEEYGVYFSRTSQCININGKFFLLLSHIFYMYG